MTDSEIKICGHGSGNPSIKNLNVYAEYRYNQKASNGVRKGIVEVRRFTALDDNGRKMFHDAYQTIIGRNIYNQDKRAFCYKKYTDGRYYSDCSSSGMATLAQIGYTVSLLNTAGIHYSGKFFGVPVTIKDGHITNPEILKPGDAILFAGSDPSRPLQIGHVEWVFEVPTDTDTKTTFSPYKVAVTASVLRIRQDHATSSPIVGRLHKTHKVTIREEYDGWGRVDCYRDDDGKEVKGWIYLDYTKKV